MRPIDDCREKLAAALGCTAQDIWPDWLDVLRDTSFTSVAIMEPGQVEQLTERIARRLVASPGVAAIESAEIREALVHCLKTLSYREREIIKLRFGLADGQCYTLEEVGHIFKVTSERIRGIEVKAIRRLQHPARLGFLAKALGEELAPE